MWKAGRPESRNSKVERACLPPLPPRCRRERSMDPALFTQTDCESCLRCALFSPTLTGGLTMKIPEIDHWEGSRRSILMRIRRGLSIASLS